MAQIKLTFKGLPDIKREIEKRMTEAFKTEGFNPKLGQDLKAMYKEAAQPIVDAARRNIDASPFQPSAKKVLKAMVVSGQGPAKKPNAFVAIYQWATGAKVASGKDGRTPNPYWFEFGTAFRATEKGARRGAVHGWPFFRPAISSSRGAVKQLLEAGIKRLLVDAK